MKIKSIAIAALYTTVLGLVGEDILKPSHPVLAQTNFNQILIVSSLQEGILTANDPKAEINLYTEPTPRSRVKGYGKVGDRVEILNQVRSREGLTLRLRSGSTWYEVRFPFSDEVGWVRSEFIRVTNRPSTPSNQSLSWSQNGNGSFALAGRRDQEITSVSVNIDRNGRAELAFRLADNRLMRFGGKLVARDPYSIIINLTNSGNADATGTVNIERGQNNTIQRIFADGKLDGQRFSIHFNHNNRSRSSQPSNVVGKNINHVVKRLRHEGWVVIKSARNMIQLNRGQQGIDLEFNPRTSSVTCVRVIDTRSLIN